MSPRNPVTPSSPIEDQIRYLDDFLREGGGVDEDPTPSPDAANTRRQALQRIRGLLAEVHQHILAHPDF